MDPNAREKLKEKLRKKRQSARRNTVPSLDPDLGEMDLVKMMEQVNNVLRTNPQMVKQISKCVSNVMNNKNLMNKNGI